MTRTRPPKLTDQQIIVRAEKRKARRMRVFQDHRSEKLLGRAGRQAARNAAPGRMRGWQTPTGNALPEADALLLQTGEAAVQDPALAGVISPDVLVPVGESVLVAADVRGPKGYVGLQWVNQDGTGGRIAWAGGRGRVSVTDTCPDTAKGARMILIVFARPGDLAAAGADVATLFIQADLRRWRRNQGVDDNA